jgi:hypothetical protein
MILMICIQVKEQEQGYSGDVVTTLSLSRLLCLIPTFGTPYSQPTFSAPPFSSRCLRMSTRGTYNDATAKVAITAIQCKLGSRTIGGLYKHQSKIAVSQ